MATRIRLARYGAKKKPYYQIVVTDGRSPRGSSFIETIGNYNPALKNEDPNKVIFKEERLNYWLSVGAQPSDRVVVFLKNRGLGQKVKSVQEANKRNVKRYEDVKRIKEEKRRKEEAANAAEEAKAAAGALPAAPAA